MQMFKIETEKINADISARGAEIVRICDKNGREYLWDGRPLYWATRAPLLFPMIGRAYDNKIRVNGNAYLIPQHGFARLCDFSPTYASKRRCDLLLMSSKNTLCQYPFRFRLLVSYDIQDYTLYLNATVINDDEESLPISFGFHPAFLWPLSQEVRKEEYHILFEKTENSPVRRLRDGYLVHQEFDSPVTGRDLSLASSLFEEDTLIFDQLKSRRVTYGASDGPSIEVYFPDMPHLGIWTKPGAGFICIEPLQAAASPEGFDDEFSMRPGIELLPPGDTREFRVELTIRFD